MGQRWLESQVVEVVQQHVTRAVTSGALVKALDAVLGEQPNEHAPRKQMEAQRRALEGERDVIIKKVAKGLFSDEEATRLLTGIRAQLVTVKEELNKLAEPTSQTDRTAERDQALALARDLPRLLKQAGGQAAREIIGQWVAGGTFNPTSRTGVLKLRALPPLATARLHVVTQCMSHTTVLLGSVSSSSYVMEKGRSTCPETMNDHFDVSTVGTLP